MEHGPELEFVEIVHTHSKAALVALCIISLLLVTLVIYFTFLLIKASRREMALCAALIKQKEATQLAERKSMRKSFGFATTSHDIRNFLAALNGLIDECKKGVSPNSDLAEYLECMKKTTASLIDLLNSVLDASKIESGKMKLMEKDFSIAHLIEESVDLYYPNAMEKGIDLVLDPCDGSVMKQGLVKGDSGRLKQVLNNLLHNAIKFTHVGHIVVRAWAMKPSPKKHVSVSKNSRYWNYLSRSSMFKIKDPQNVLNSFGVEQQCQNLIEFLIEVDDNGNRIPKEKRNLVFEDFVQARETSLDRDEGTGLGLGIVQSLVRLMGGDICITEKNPGDNGTCFRFNIFLSTCENISVTSTCEVEKCRLLPDKISMETYPWDLSPKLEVSNIVLFMKQGERRKVLHHFFESQGSKVTLINSCELVFSTLERIKRKGDLRHQSSPNHPDISSTSDSTSTLTSYRTRDVSINIEDGSDSHMRTSINGGFSFVLIIVDYNAIKSIDAEFSECYSILESFKKDVGESRCKVVWLYTPKTDLQARQDDQRKLANCELIMSKPLHGSRLLQILKLLPEYGRVPTIQGYKSSFAREFTRSSDRWSKTSQSHLDEEIIETSEKVLSRKNILVAEDNDMLYALTRRLLERHGANVTLCVNGEEALKLVCDGLRHNGKSPSQLPYDVIFMDCEMPIMNGMEATRQIRLEEKTYNVHIPIIALTAHSEIEEHEKILLAGADAIMNKPLNDKKIYRAIQLIN